MVIVHELVTDLGMSSTKNDIELYILKTTKQRRNEDIQELIILEMFAVGCDLTMYIYINTLEIDTWVYLPMYNM